MRAILAIPSVPLIWIYAFGVTAVALLFDLVALPFVRRRSGVDEPVGGRDASIIILNWNGEGFLRELLPTVKAAVERCPGDHEVIVVDNGSTDGSADLVTGEYPWARLVALPTNLFFIRGNRAGVEVATRDILVFLNNDMRVEPDFLVKLLEPFGPPDVFAVTARIEMDDGDEETGRTRGRFSRSQLYHVRTEHRGDMIPVLWAGGGSSAFDRRKYLELGGFEDLYSPCYVEDVSLSYQAWRRGWRSLYAYDSVVHHVRRGTSERTLGSREVERLQRRNKELFFWRSVTAPGLMLARAFYLPWDFLKGGLPGAFSSLAGVLRRLPRALLQRQRSRGRSRYSDREVLRLACHVSSHRCAVAPRVGGPIVILALGKRSMTSEVADGCEVLHVELAPPSVAGPPQEDLFRLLPRRFWNVARNGPYRERVRDVLCEIDHDLVVGDPWMMAAAEPWLSGSNTLLWLDELADEESWIERVRRDRLLLRLARRTSAVIADGVSAKVLKGSGLRVVEPREFPAIANELVGKGDG